MIIGIAFFGLAYFFWLVPIIFNETPSQTQDKINIAYSNNIIITGFDFNFVTSKPQMINIHYSLLNTNNKTGFVALDLPYTGVLKNTDPGWKIEKFDDTHSRVIYKNYTCTSQKPCLFDSGDLSFVVNDSFNSVKAFHHYIQVPFSTGPENSKIIDFYNALSKIPSFKQGWAIGGIPYLNIYLDKDDDQWNTQPTSDLNSFKNSNGDVHVILVWAVNKSNTIIAADYTSEKDRFLRDMSPVLFGAFIGVAITMLVASVQLKLQDNDKKFLKNSIDGTETRINETLSHVKEIVDKEHLDKKIKTEEENRIYKISLLHDLSGIIMAIYQTLNDEQAKTDENKVIKPDMKKIIEFHAEEYRYWSERISVINTNTYVPAEIRDTVSILLHEGIKPIYSPSFALKYDFLEKVFLNHLDKILGSDYVLKDNDASVQHYLKSIQTSRDLLLTLKSKSDTS